MTLLAPLLTAEPCACCGALAVRGPYIGRQAGPFYDIDLYQCHGDFNGKRCENTRGVRRGGAAPILGTAPRGG